jgi:hypothetical protein
MSWQIQTEATQSMGPNAKVNRKLQAEVESAMVAEETMSQVTRLIARCVFFQWQANATEVTIKVSLRPTIPTLPLQPR